MYEWFVDCYRMRIDDDCVWGGGNLHGIYDSDATNLDIIKDFLIFCKLAKIRSIIPELNWNWNELLIIALKLLPFAFEKSDAQTKYGSENVFTTMNGGRSLRFTGELIYASSVQSPVNQDELFNKISNEIKNKSLKNLKLDEFGGLDIWNDLVTKLPSRRR